VAEPTEVTQPAAVNAPAAVVVPDEHKTGAEWVLKDIDRSIDYRRKFYDYSVAIATGLLAFSISFPPTLTAIHYVRLVRVSWIALGISILCGVSVHFAWSKFFIAYRDFDNRGHRDAGLTNRKKWTAWRRRLEFTQFLTLLIGVMGMTIFAAVNYQYIAPHTNDNSSSTKTALPKP